MKFKCVNIENYREAIQWTGNNLKEVLEFTGKNEKFDEWFSSFEQYEEFVKEDDNIFKLFSHSCKWSEKAYVGDYLLQTYSGNIVVMDKYYFEKNYIRL